MKTITRTKSLISLSLVLAFAVALQDGDQVAFKTHASFSNAKYQYLNARTATGSVGMAKSTDYATLSGTWWKAHKLSDGSWGFESLGNKPNSRHIYLNGDTKKGSVNLVGSTQASGTHWTLEQLSDGTVALKNLGSSKKAKFVYLNTDTNVGAVNLAKRTDSAKASGTHWEIVTLVSASSHDSIIVNEPAVSENDQIPAENTQLADFIQTHADELKEGSSIDVGYCLKQFDPTAFAAKYGPIMISIIEAGCVNGLQNCNMNDLYGALDRLKGSGTSEDTIKKIYIFIGSIIGSLSGGRFCGGARTCEMLGGRIGAVLTCLSVSKEVFQGVETAISTLKDVTNQAGDIGQDAINAIHDTANSVEDGVQDAIDQISKGAQDDAVNALKGVTDDVGQGFTDLGNSIAGGLNDVGGAIVGAGQQAVGAVEGAGQQAVGAVEGAGQQAVGAVEGVGQDIGNGFCGIFGC